MPVSSTPPGGCEGTHGSRRGSHQKLREPLTRRQWPVLPPQTASKLAKGVSRHNWRLKIPARGTRSGAHKCDFNGASNRRVGRSILQLISADGTSVAVAFTLFVKTGTSVCHGNTLHSFSTLASLQNDTSRSSSLNNKKERITGILKKIWLLLLLSGYRESPSLISCSAVLLRQWLKVR